MARILYWKKPFYIRVDDFKALKYLSIFFVQKSNIYKKIVK